MNFSRLVDDIVTHLSCSFLDSFHKVFGIFNRPIIYIIGQEGPPILHNIYVGENVGQSSI